MKNLRIEDEDRFNQIMTSDDSITVVSDGALKNHGSFGWVAAIDKEVFMTCRGKGKGCADQMSSFRSKATGMLSAVYDLYRIKEQLNTKYRCSIWTNSDALVIRMKKMIEYDPISVNLKMTRISTVECGS